MKKIVTCIVTIALVFGLIALFTPTELVADPGNGKGKGICKVNMKQCEKWCGQPPEGCSWYHCSKCGCDPICP